MGENTTVSLFVANIQGSSDLSKMSDLRARTSFADFIILNETNKRPGDESTIDVKCDGAVISNSPASGAGPGFGSFFGFKHVRPNSGDSIDTHEKFEIGVMKKYFESGIKMAVIMAVTAASCGLRLCGT